MESDTIKYQPPGTVVDAADLRIVRALLHDPLASVADVARAVRLGDSATRARVKRLREDGVLDQIAAVPNGRLLGQRYVVALYSKGDWREMLRMESVVGCSVNHEGVVAPTCLTTGAVPDELVARYGEPERVFVQHDAPLHPAGVVLSDVQWRVLSAFVAEPTATDRRLADATGLAARTVKRHRAAFVRGNHVRMEIDVRGLRGGGALFHLYVQGPGSHDDVVRDRLAERLGGAWPQQQIAQPRGVLFFCSADDLAAAAAAPRFAREELPGVEHAELVVSVEGAYDLQKLASACDAARGGHVNGRA